MRTLLLRTALLIAALPPLIAGLRAPKRHFVVQHFRPATEAPLYRTEDLPAVKTRFVHGASLAELANGDLVAAWYGGSDETKPDVVLYSSVLAHATMRWSEPRVILDRISVRNSLKIPVKSLGNPLLFADRNGLHLFFVAVVAGGWSGGTIGVIDSPDGRRWSRARHIVTSPVLNAGMLVRGMPAAYDDGTIALPIYHQLGAKWAAVATLSPNGELLDENRIGHQAPLIQPWLIPTGPDDAYLLLRHSARDPFCVTLSHTNDAGGTWSEVLPTPLVHRDSAVAGVELMDRSILVFYNNTAWDRRDLSVARSIDGGVHWSWPHPIERDTVEDLRIRHEYSYPFVIRTRDGRIHVVYTWQRTRIRHLVFNDSWVAQDPKLRVMR